jgi:hypothetical protein
MVEIWREVVNADLSCSNIGSGCRPWVCRGVTQLVVFVDQAIQNGFSADSLNIEVGCRTAGNFTPAAGNLEGPITLSCSLSCDVAVG